MERMLDHESNVHQQLRFMAGSLNVDFINAAGLFREDRDNEIIAAVLNITLSILGAKTIGLAGVLLGTVVSQMWFWFGRSYVVFKLCLQADKEDYLKYWLKNIVDGFALTVSIVFCAYLNSRLPIANDMYPQFWTPRIGGIFMKYSYEYKKNCIELYRQGKWPETPDGIKQENFRISVRRWSRREKSCGAESLQKNQKKMWSADEKYELIAKVLAGVSITESAISAGVEPSLLSQWVRCYKMKGYQGLAAQRKGRPPKEPDMKKKIVPAELTPSEREELIRLRAENEYLRTENEVIKKRIALRQEKFAAQLKAKKLHSSTNSEEKDTL